MLVDERVKTLAKNLINYSVRLKKGESVLIEATGVDYQIVGCLVNEAIKVGGFPYVHIKDSRVERAIQMGMSEEYAKKLADIDGYRMDKMDAYIAIRGGENAFEGSDVPQDRAKTYAAYYSQPVHMDKRLKNTKWVVLRYPTQGMSSQNSTSTEAFEDFYFNVCNLDYQKMADAMTPLVKLIEKTDKVRIIAKDTDISFSIKGIGAVKCCGLRNIPDGEVYTAPIRDSVNGRITYNTASVKNGIRFENISLLFKDGKIIEATSNHNKEINDIFNTDEGARYVGEFALGVNPYINKAMCDTLFDEKISGSIHFTPGNAYDATDNKNRSSIHWDLVQIQTKQMGGGEIYFDDVLIRKDGIFVIDELKGLNPENLK